MTDARDRGDVTDGVRQAPRRAGNRDGKVMTGPRSAVPGSLALAQLQSGGPIVGAPATSPAQCQRVEWSSPGGHEPSQATDQRLPPIDWLTRVRIASLRDRKCLCQHAPEWSEAIPASLPYPPVKVAPRNARPPNANR